MSDGPIFKIGDRVHIEVPEGRAQGWNASLLASMQGRAATVRAIKPITDHEASMGDTAKILVDFDEPIPSSWSGSPVSSFHFDATELDPCDPGAGEATP